MSNVPPPIPAPRQKRETFHSIWTRIPRVWKTLTLIAAIFGAGAVGMAYVDEKASGFVEKSTFDATTHEGRVERDELRQRISELQSQEAARDAELKAIKDDTTAMRDDVRQLLNFMLANPPTRRQQP
jgi:uncharacterized protein HemX